MVGLNTFGLLYFGYDPLYARPKYPRVSFVNGAFYKRRLGRSAIRASMDVFRDSFEAEQG